MTTRALSFGQAAAAYERYRPGYPDELVDAVLGYAQRPISTALEIGAGTGKATRAFVRRGIAVTATEPDAEMLAELRTAVPATAHVVQATLEELPPGGAYDLVYAAASLHWTLADGRWRRIREQLASGGTFACFGGALQLADDALEEALRDAVEDLVGSADIPAPDGTPPDSSMQWPGSELERDDRFTDVRQIDLPSSSSCTRAEWLGHLGTVSAYLELPVSTRKLVFAKIEQLLPATVTYRRELTLHLATASS